MIVDELHELAPNDRGAQLAVTLERLDAFVGRRVRRVGLSATLGNPEAVARFLSPKPRSVSVRVTVVSLCTSEMIKLILAPPSDLMPPASLIISTASLAAATQPTPICAMLPVVG